MDDTWDETEASEDDVDKEITVFVSLPVQLIDAPRLVSSRRKGMTYAPTPRSSRTPRGGRMKARMILMMSLGCVLACCAGDAASAMRASCS